MTQEINPQAEADLAAAIAGLKGEEETAEETTSKGDELAAQTPEADAQAADEKTDAEAKPAAGRSQKLQKILDKYDGDEEAAAEAIFESWNTGSKQSKELANLKRELIALKNKELDAAPVASQDLQDISREYHEAVAELTMNSNRQNELVESLAKVEKNISKLEGKLEIADLDDKRDIKSDLKDLAATKRELVSEWKEVDRRNRGLEKDRNALAKKYGETEAGLKAARAQKHQEKAEAEDFNRDFGDLFDSTVFRVAQDSGVPEASLEFLMKTMRNAGTAHLLAQGDDGLGFQNEKDIEKFVKEGVQQYAKDRGYQKKAALKQVSEGKLSVTKTSPQASGKVQLPKLPTGMEEPKGKWSVEYARKRAEALMP